jgi:hypothetical protein
VTIRRTCHVEPFDILMVRHVEPFDSMKLQALGWLRAYDCHIGIKYLVILSHTVSGAFVLLRPARLPVAVVFSTHA